MIINQGIICGNVIRIRQNIPNHRIGHFNRIRSSACSSNGGLVRLGSTEFVFIKPYHIAASIGRQNLIEGPGLHVAGLDGAINNFQGAYGGLLYFVLSYGIVL